jgi:hypothetical protein
MPRLVGPHECVTEVEAGGMIHRRQPDGTFHVTDSMAKHLRHASCGDLTEVGRRFDDTHPGYRCQACGFLAFFADHCGRCGSTELVVEARAATDRIGPLGVVA